MNLFYKLLFSSLVALPLLAILIAISALTPSWRWTAGLIAVSAAGLTCLRIYQPGAGLDWFTIAFAIAVFGYAAVEYAWRRRSDLRT